MCDQGIVPPGDVHDLRDSALFSSAADRLSEWGLSKEVAWEAILQHLEEVYREVARLALHRANHHTWVPPEALVEALSKILVWDIRLEIAKCMGDSAAIAREELIEACRRAAQLPSSRTLRGTVEDSAA